LVKAQELQTILGISRKVDKPTGEKHWSEVEKCQNSRKGLENRDPHPAANKQNNESERVGEFDQSG
jgi:hypothetical protein